MGEFQFWHSFPLWDSSQWVPEHAISAHTRQTDRNTVNTRMTDGNWSECIRCGVEHRAQMHIYKVFRVNGREQLSLRCFVGYCRTHAVEHASYESVARWVNYGFKMRGKFYACLDGCRLHGLLAEKTVRHSGADRVVLYVTDYGENILRIYYELLDELQEKAEAERSRRLEKKARLAAKRSNK
jgi:hypothetical protein